MTYERVMNASGSLGHGSGSGISGGAFLVVTAPSLTNFAGVPGVHRGPLAFNFTGGNYVGFDSGSVAGFGTINPTSVEAFADGLAMVREGDVGTMAALGTVGGTPTVVPGSPPVVVSDAGQTKVLSQ